MRKITLALAILGATLSGALYTAPAYAQASRTWISGVGDDANPCSRTAPCKTFAGAISKTAAGGEIDALDPGGFGAVTITKAITFDGGGGQVASILVAGTNGINVAAGANDVVIIRNLRINGILQTASPGINGISFTSGKELIVDRCDVFGFNTNGINVALTASANLVVRDSTFNNIAQNGINVTTTSGFAVAEISNSTFTGPGGGSGNGVTAASNGFVTVSNSVFPSLNNGAQTTAGGSLSVDTSLFTNNITALNATSGTTINVSNNSFYNNGTAFGGAGAYTSANNNKIVGTQGATPGAMNVK
jgi:hypothetical protein